MKRNFKYYTAIWTIVFVIYNFVLFTIEPIFGFKVIEYDDSFWISWVFIIASFINQLACSYFTFKEDNSDKLFLNVPLFKFSYFGTLSLTIVSTIGMFNTNIPYWITRILSLIIFAFTTIILIKAIAASENVSDIGNNVKVNTIFIKSLTVDSETLLNKTTDKQAKQELKKVYEAIKYSDPMSKDVLANIEAQITVSFSNLVNAVDKNDIDTIKQLANELLILINDRNNKCKLLK